MKTNSCFLSHCKYTFSCSELSLVICARSSGDDTNIEIKVALLWYRHHSVLTLVVLKLLCKSLTEYFELALTELTAKIFFGICLFTRCSILVQKVSENSPTKQKNPNPQSIANMSVKKAAKQFLPWWSQNPSEQRKGQLYLGIYFVQTRRLSFFGEQPFEKLLESHQFHLDAASEQGW